MSEQESFLEIASSMKGLIDTLKLGLGRGSWVKEDIDCLDKRCHDFTTMIQGEANGNSECLAREAVYICGQIMFPARYFAPSNATAGRLLAEANAVREKAENIIRSKIREKAKK